MTTAVAELPHALGGPVLEARIRAQDEDFRVDEVDAFEASGAGEHLLLTVEKRGMNTAFAARALAAWAGIEVDAIGYAGLKDRHAITRQRFTLHLPGREAPALDTLQVEGLRVLESHRHSRKLPRGALAGNAFVLVLREVRGDRDAAEARLAALAARGVPNYFGEQRFGRGGANVTQALAMFASAGGRSGRRMRREERSMLISAARSELFNRVLALRVEQDCWDRALEGEVWMLDGSRSVFGPEPLDDSLMTRLAAFDIHPTAPLWGRGESRATGAALRLECDALGAEDALALRAGLEREGLKQERRATRLRPQDLAWDWRGDDVLELRFALPTGAYATTVLRELATTVGSLD
ncbi:tRNA pseudouridine(13) synthase TruD [Luteimonas yindakuii]|uniref:tRNA pseudouridine synthase D n=1 Tax=Luteimonas yindakuii TaxID=2565782 RepID=A0A4Z1RBJ8_9GAMM|nr:tRNA pseudouridine(13) synthase TruD [Luteimonas yindakuii]TKS53543.1 tRNA pseudouridine(13) synthase TruD [Luteimonas yindakuii]